MAGWYEAPLYQVLSLERGRRRSPKKRPCDAVNMASRGEILQWAGKWKGDGMIDYETFCRIHALHGQEGLTICQIAKALQLHEDTVSRWLKRARFVPRKQGARLVSSQACIVALTRCILLPQQGGVNKAIQVYRRFATTSLSDKRHSPQRGCADFPLSCVEQLGTYHSDMHTSYSPYSAKNLLQSKRQYKLDFTLASWILSRGELWLWLERHPYSAIQLFQRMKEEGYEGGYSILKKFVRTVRPQREKAFLSLHLSRASARRLIGDIAE